MPKPVFQIAIAVVRRHGHWLVARRPRTAHLGGQWEFPGGKIHVGESPRQAALRELREECAVQAAALRDLPSAECEYARRIVHITPVLCCWERGEPQPLASDACSWVSTAEMHALDMPAVNRAIIAAAVEAFAELESKDFSA